MKNNIFLKPKNVFLDVVNAKDFIHLDRVSTIYQSLKDSVKKPLKLILLYGKPGTGKSMILNKLYTDLSPRQKVVLYKTPIIDESEFFKSLAFDLYDITLKEDVTFTYFNKISTLKTFKEVPLVLLDEAQLYSAPLMEKIRLLSDERKIKFLVTLHKTEKEDLIAKEHFQTRIWESIELVNATGPELTKYVQKKLMKVNCFDIANMFNEKNIKLIHKFTNGNYRQTNKLIFTLFSIYEWYEENQPSKLDYNKVSNKLIEMAALESGLINA